MINLKDINEIENNNRDNLITGDKNFLVEAGAGAGKTFLLVNRLVDLIINKNIKPKEIVAITFTVKAATDLKKRIYDEFAKRAKTDNKIKNILEFIPEIQIGTIHSFCNSIISRRPFDAGLSMNYRLLEDSEYERYLSKMYEEFEDNIYKYVDKYTADIFLHLNHRSRIIENFSKFAMNESVDFPVIEGFENFTETVYLEEVKEIFSHLDRINDLDVATLRKAAIEPLSKIKNVLGLKDKNSILKTANDIYKLVIENPESPFIKTRFPKDISDKEKEKAKDLIPETSDIGDRLKSATDLWKNVVYRTHIRVSLAFVKYIDEKNKENSVVSNDDLLRYSLDILMIKENRDYFQKIYRYIFVDESQDTDLVQIKIILSLISSGDINKNTPISEYKMLSNRIFMVGDRKQSIYRFRGADLNTYEIVKNLFENTDNAEFVNLKKSFRFQKHLASDIEKCFENTMVSNYGEYDIGVGHILVDEKNSSDSGIYITKLNTDNFQDVVNSYKKADIIKSLVETDKDKENFILKSLISKEKVEIELESLEDSKKSKIKFLKGNSDTLYLKAKFLVIDLLKSGIEPKDILILTMGNEGARAVTNILRDDGLKVDSTSEENYFSYESVKRSYIAIRFFENPIPSNYFEFLIKILNKDPVKIKKESEVINNLGFEEYLKNKPEILNEEEFEFISKYLVLFKENRESALMSLYYEDIFFDGNYTENEYEVFYSFFREVLASGLNLGNIKEKNEVTFKPGISSAIKVMNIHKAKGLEGKHVILIEERSLRINSDDYFDRISNKGYLEFRTGYSRNIILDHGNEEAREKSILENFKEYIRLFYVAITRAKEELYLISNEGFYEKQLSFASTKEIFNSSYNSVDSSREYKSFKDSIIYPNLSEKLKTNEEISLAFTDNIYHGTYYGIIFHKVMEKSIEIIKSDGEVDIEKILKVAIIDFINGEDVNIENITSILDIKNDINIERVIFEKLKSQVKRNATNNLDILKDKVKSSKKTYTELPFTYLRDGHIHSGRMDLILLFDDFIEIYDYKTDIDISDNSKKYMMQLESYKDAASEILGVDRDKINTHILRSNN